MLSIEEYEKLTEPRLFISKTHLSNKDLIEELNRVSNYGIIGEVSGSVELLPTRAEIETATAEKILKDLIKNCTYTFSINNKPIVALNGDFALKIAKQFGVEIRE